MTKLAVRRFAGALGVAGAGSLFMAFVGTSAASSASASTTAVHSGARAASCHPAQLAGSGGFLGHFKDVCLVASTVPANGDLNPYGVAVVPTTTGDLVAGDVLVSNFNNSKNEQGTGSTIMEISPSGQAKLFANLATQTKNHVGLTTALTVFRNGVVVVGSLPTTDGTAKTASAGDLYFLNGVGRLIETLGGPNVNGPWDLASYDGGAGFGVLFVTNVLNGTVAANGAVVHKGNVVRFVLDFTKWPPHVPQEVVIGSGFPERTDPSALVIGPTGVALGSNGTVYVADTLDNRIAAIPDGLFATASAGTGTTVSSGQFLKGPLGLAVAPGGDLVSANGATGQLVESTLAGTQPEWPTVDSSGSPPGAGDLFGLEVQPGGTGLYFVDDGTNTLELFK
jgi:hypothetical protein